MEKNQKPLKIFLDASVIVAAVISSQGGSFRILNESQLRGFQLITSRYAYRETENNITEKYPHLLTELYQLTPLFRLTTSPPKKFIKALLKIIDFKDAPVLAAFLKEKADILITLDRKHFIENSKLSDFQNKIMTPGDFIQKYFY